MRVDRQHEPETAGFMRALLLGDDDRLAVVAPFADGWQRRLRLGRRARFDGGELGISLLRVRRAHRLGLGLDVACDGGFPDGAALHAGRGLDAADGTLLSRAKHLTLWLLGQATQKYGKAFSTEQEVAARLADMAIEVYALESAILRAGKLNARGSGYAAMASDMVQVFSSDSADRLWHAAKNALAAVAGSDAAAPIEQVHGLLHHAPVDTIAARRRIGFRAA